MTTDLPEAADLRAVLGRTRIVHEQYVTVLTRAASQMGQSRFAVQWELMAAVSAAHAEATANLQVVAESLGLPYSASIEASFEEMPDA